jgi:hypothetical protein
MKTIYPLLLVILFTGCNSAKAPDPSQKTSAAAAGSSGTGSSSTPPNVLDTPPTGDPTTIAAIPTTMGVRSFEEIHYSMATVTGISGNTTIINRYNGLKSKLPVDNDIKSFSFSKQNAIAVLAAEYCNALVNNTMYATQLQQAIGNFNTNTLPATAFGNGVGNMIAQNLLNRFWGTNYSNLPNAATTQASIVTLLNDLIAGEPNTSTTTRRAIVGACTSVLASSPVSSL